MTHLKGVPLCAGTFRMGLVTLRDRDKKKARCLRASNYFLGGE
jgi:hypothetical protein